jgi:hypothetical protein
MKNTEALTPSRKINFLVDREIRDVSDRKGIMIEYMLGCKACHISLTCFQASRQHVLLVHA